MLWRRQQPGKMFVLPLTQALRHASVVPGPSMLVQPAFSTLRVGGVPSVEHLCSDDLSGQECRSAADSLPGMQLIHDFRRQQPDS